MTEQEFQYIRDKFEWFERFQRERFEHLDEGQQQLSHDMKDRIDNITRVQITHEKHDNERFQELNKELGAIRIRIAYFAGGCSILFILLKLLAG